MHLDGKSLGGRGDWRGSGGGGGGARVEQFVDQSLDVDMTVILSGLNIVSTLLVLAQHRQAKVLDEIRQLLSGGNSAPVVVMVVMIPSITNDACKPSQRNVNILLFLSKK